MTERLRYEIDARDAASREIKNISDSFRRLDRQLNQTGKGLQKVEHHTKRVNNTANGFDASAAKARSFGLQTAALAGAFASSAFAAQAFTRDLIDTQTALERAESRFRVAFGADAAAGMQYANQVAKDLDLSIRETRDSFSLFAAATKGTALEGRETEKIFLAVARAAKSLRLSTDDTRGVFRALTQIIGKGKLSAEEIRQQLGERLPGAFGIFARSLGLSTSELDKFLSEGLLTAEFALPKFREELERTNSKLSDSDDSLQSSLNRAANEWENLKVSILEGGVGDALKTIAKDAEGLLQAFQNFPGGIAAVGGTVAGSLYQVPASVAQIAGDFYSKSVDQFGVESTKLGFEALKKEIADANIELERLSNYRGNVGFGDAIERQSRKVQELTSRLEKLQATKARTDSLRETFESASRGPVPIDPFQFGFADSFQDPRTLQQTMAAGKTVNQPLEKFKNVDLDTRTRDQTLDEVAQKKQRAAVDRIFKSTRSPEENIRQKIETLNAARGLSDETDQKIDASLTALQSKLDDLKSSSSKINVDANALIASFRTQEEILQSQRDRLLEINENGLVNARNQDQYALALERVEQRLQNIRNTDQNQRQEEADRITQSFMTQEEQLMKVRERLVELYQMDGIEIEAFQSTLKKINDELKTDDSATEFHDTWKEAIQGVSQELSSMIMQGEIDLDRIAQKILDTFLSSAIDNMLGNVMGGLGLPGFASGGFPDPSQPYIAGERGPELIVPAGISQRVFNAQETSSIFKNAGSRPAVSIQSSVVLNGEARKTDIDQITTAVQQQIMSTMVDAGRRGVI